LKVPQILFFPILLSHVAMLGSDFDKLPLLSNSYGKWSAIECVARKMFGLHRWFPYFVSTLSSFFT